MCCEGSMTGPGPPLQDCQAGLAPSFLPNLSPGVWPGLGTWCRQGGGGHLTSLLPSLPASCPSVHSPFFSASFSKDTCVCIISCLLPVLQGPFRKVTGASSCFSQLCPLCTRSTSTRSSGFAHSPCVALGLPESAKGVREAQGRLV